MFQLNRPSLRQRFARQLRFRLPDAAKSLRVIQNISILIASKSLTPVLAFVRHLSSSPNLDRKGLVRNKSTQEAPFRQTKLLRAMERSQSWQPAFVLPVAS
jgi:hypothetical protein